MSFAKLSIGACLLLFSTALAGAVPATATTDLNVRSGQGTNHRVVGVLPGGATVHVRGCGDGWCYVREYGGYASARYLDPMPYGSRSALLGGSFDVSPYYAPGGLGWLGRPRHFSRVHSGYGFGAGWNFGRSAYGSAEFAIAPYYAPGGLGWLGHPRHFSRTHSWRPHW